MYIERSATIMTIQTQPYMEFSYLRTLAGVLKVIELILNFLVFICVIAGPFSYFAGVGWSSFVSCTAFSVTLTLLLLYIFHVVETYPTIPWLLTEMIYCIFCAIFFFITGCVLATDAVSVAYGGAWAAGSFFAFGAMICYGFDVFLKYTSWKNGESPQMTLPTAVTQQSTSVH
uniref:MARVEL domain-containing protein n=1 Tax=Romanomermis culicivorax TaxID=13658 RepID=A0A915L447_ROMCU